MQYKVVYCTAFIVQLRPVHSITVLQSSCYHVVVSCRRIIVLSRVFYIIYKLTDIRCIRCCTMPDIRTLFLRVSIKSTLCHEYSSIYIVVYNVPAVPSTLACYWAAGTAAALLENNETSAKITTANGRTFT